MTISQTSRRRVVNCAERGQALTLPVEIHENVHGEQFVIGRNHFDNGQPPQHCMHAFKRNESVTLLDVMCMHSTA
jgi:hypothetical protein